MAREDIQTVMNRQCVKYEYYYLSQQTICSLEDILRGYLFHYSHIGSKKLINSVTYSDPAKSEILTSFLTEIAEINILCFLSIWAEENTVSEIID